MIDENDGASHGWYIDAWDPRGGRAFISWRPTDIGDVPRLDYPATYVCPPHFQPEHLSSRSIALAATHGMFQLGLFDEEAEVAFVSLDEAVSFVRRGYGSGGATPIPGGSSPPRAPEGGEGGPLIDPPRPERGHLPTFADGFRDGIELFWKKVGGLDRDRSEVSLALEWTSVQGQMDQEVNNAQLSYAGRVLLKELLDRRLGLADKEADAGWLDVYAQLIGFLAGLGVLPNSTRELAQLDRRYESSAREIISLVSVSTNAYFRALWTGRQVTVADAYEFLARLPVPRELGRGHPNPSLLSLLCMTLGAPTQSKHFEAVSAVMLLASVCVLRLGRQPFEALPAPDLGREAWTWFSAQLPDRVFRPSLEAIIGSIPTAWDLGQLDKHTDFVPAPDPVEIPDDDELEAALRDGPLEDFYDELAEQIRQDRANDPDIGQEFR